jgi:diguanylate cyclase (GGDEF)-like protein
MDNFKTYNDRYGHLEGDKILVSVADLLTANVRDTDVVARYGGDEFVLLLLGATKDQAVAFAQRCVSLIREYKFEGEDPIGPLTISAGVATYPEDATNPENIIKKADGEMYAAKRAGGNQVRAVGV